MKRVQVIGAVPSRLLAEYLDQLGECEGIPSATPMRAGSPTLDHDIKPFVAPLKSRRNDRDATPRSRRREKW